MSRRHRADKRLITPDPKYHNEVVAKFMNSVMYQGKKSVAENIVYGAFDIIEQKAKQDPLAVFRSALDNVMPSIEVRSRRVGGATYQVPVEVRTDRRQALAIRWLLGAARGRNERTMTEKLSGELLDAMGVAMADGYVKWPARLRTRYERLRAHLGGVGAARLVGDRCEGCHLTLPSMELERIHHLPADTFATCPQCDRILVH